MGSAKTHKKHTDLKSKINEILWDGTFYKSIHGEELLENPSFEILPDCQNVKELMGYVPWIYGIAPEGRDKAFEELKTPDCFFTEGILLFDKQTIVLPLASCYN